MLSFLVSAQVPKIFHGDNMNSKTEYKKNGTYSGRYNFRSILSYIDYVVHTSTLPYFYNNLHHSKHTQVIGYYLHFKKLTVGSLN